MSFMLKFKFRFRDFILFGCILGLCFAVSQLMQDIFNIPEQVTTTFAFAVFLIALLTDGYFWGLAASLVSMLLVNYAFTAPYFALNFVIPSNFYSAVVMALIAILTSALTTKVKRQEAMKAETEKERIRANLLRAISHDLRTPLTTIYGSSAALRENADTLTDAQKDKMLLGIQQDAQWLVRMVENLLSITRMDSGNVHITTVLTAVDELVDSVLLKFYKRYPNQEISLQLPDDPVLISVDCMLMEQVLINLLENAVQHASGATRITLRATPQDNQIIFEVEDNGCGIAPERLPYLFSGYFLPGEQIADNTRRNAGIGLSLCATIIRAHGGTIEAVNNATGGATFRFTLKSEDMTDEQQI